MRWFQLNIDQEKEKNINNNKTTVELGKEPEFKVITGKLLPLLILVYSRIILFCRRLNSVNVLVPAQIQNTGTKRKRRPLQQTYY